MITNSNPNKNYNKQIKNIYIKNLAFYIILTLKLRIQKIKYKSQIIS